jgi:hypothetical protein
MNESDANAALRAQGITNPSKSLIRNWLRVQRYEEKASPPPTLRETVGDMQPCVSSSVSLEDTTSVGRPSSESALEPMLRERGELARPAGRRKAGRPCVQASWFQAVATVMSDGTPLRQALAAVGVQGLTASQIRSLYRNSVLKAMRREARQKWLREWGVAPKARRHYACKGGFPLGMSPQMRRIL